MMLYDFLIFDGMFEGAARFVMYLVGFVVILSFAGIVKSLLDGEHDSSRRLARWLIAFLVGITILVVFINFFGG